MPTIRSHHPQFPEASWGNLRVKIVDFAVGASDVYPAGANVGFAFPPAALGLSEIHGVFDLTKFQVSDVVQHTLYNPANETLRVFLGSTGAEAADSASGYQNQTVRLVVVGV